MVLSIIRLVDTGITSHVINHSTWVQDTIAFVSNRLADTGFPLTCRIHGANNIHQHPDDPQQPQTEDGQTPQTDIGATTDPYMVSQVTANPATADQKSPTYRSNLAHDLSQCSAEVHRACWCVNFIAEHTRLKEDSTKVRLTDWELFQTQNMNPPMWGRSLVRSIRLE